MRILITGIEGFTGRYIANELLSKGHELFGLKANILSAEALSKEIQGIKPDCVIHLAAISFVNHEDINEVYNVNLLGTRNLLKSIKEHVPNIQSILLASSANIYGNSIGVLDENANPSPANDYAVSKISMEYMAKLWMDQLPIFIVRPFNYTGLGQSEQFLIPKIVSHFLNRAPAIELGNLNVFREFNDVRFVAEIYYKLLNNNPTGLTINVCTGKRYSLIEVVNMCKLITGHDIEITINPAFVRKNEVKELVGSNKMLKSVVGDWTDYGLEDTLRWMLDASKV